MSAEAFRAVAADASQFLDLGCAVCAVLLVAARVQEWGLSLLQMGPLLPLSGDSYKGFLCICVCSSSSPRRVPAPSAVSCLPCQTSNG